MSSTTFSYAQAAKGHTAAPSPQLTTSSAPPSTSSQAKDDVSVANSSVTAPSVASNEADSRDVSHKASHDIEAAVATQDSEVASLEVSGTPAVPIDQSTKPSRGGESTVGDSQQQRDGNASRSASRTSRSNDGPDARKGRKGKKARNNDKEAQNEPQQEEEKEKEPVKLAPAPVPAVNIWMKRQEDRAKLAPPPVAVKALVNGNDSKKSQSPEEGEVQGPAVNGVGKDKSQKKVPEQSRNGDQNQRRNGPRGTRANEKDDKSIGNLPSVEDTSAWPDPKSAALVDSTGQKSEVKTDSVEREGQEEGVKSKKNWERMDIQHTVVFNTPIGTNRGAKPRGRGGRESGSTRDGLSTTARATDATTQNASNEKAVSTNGTGAPKVASQPRESGIQARTGPQVVSSTASKRPSVDGPVPKDQRKPSVSANGGAVRETGVDTSATSHRRGRAPQGDIRLESELASTRPTGHERPKAAAEVAKEGASTANQSYPREGARAPRGRGGPYHRGGHNGATGLHVQPNSFTPSGQYNAGPYQQRQTPTGHSPPTSGQFPGYGQQSRGRGGPRFYNQGTGRSNSNGYPPRLPTQPTDLPVQPAYPAPYVATPAYNYELVGIIKAQVEYYLSIENLCKDYFLRTNMDSQGFVKLSLIQGFKRMQELTKDGNGEYLRTACLASDTLEFVIGEDQQERIRNREKWANFVLPASERVKELQNDTPIAFTSYIRPYAPPPHYHPMHQPYALASPVAAYPGYPDDAAFQTSYMNGAAQYDQLAVNGVGPNGHMYGHETQLSAEVPTFSPTYLTPLASLTNLSDHEVEMLVILENKEKPDLDSADASAAGYMSNTVYHQGPNGVSDETESPSANGEATNGLTNVPQITWLKEQFAGTHLDTMDRTPYVEIRDAALAQRQQAKETQSTETPKEMRYLYAFWSQMLLKHFNEKVYEQFRNLSLQDALQTTPSRHGLRSLLDFYKKLFDNHIPKPWLGTPVPDVFAQHFQEANETERRLGQPAESSI